MIELKNLSKIYKMKDCEVKALDNVNLMVNDGEFIGITGCSGNGKSTLINIVGGLLRPTDGEVIVNGVNVYKMNDRKISVYRNKTIGFVFQNYNLVEGISAFENVLLPLMIGKVKSSLRKKLAIGALEAVGLKERLHHKPEELSGGQKQRVALARAIVNSPQIIIADEPTGNLDEENAKNIMDMLKKINDTGVTVMMVTHDEKLEKYFSRKIKVEQGRVVM